MGQLISGGDYVVFWPENISFLRHFAFFAWDATVNFGFNSVGSLHSAPYSMYMGWIGLLVGDQTLWWERIVWWLPFFIFSFASSNFLIKKIFPENKFWYLAPFVFLFNTYVFMMVGGGQIGGLGLAYSIAPFVLYSFIRTINSLESGSKNLKFSLLSGLLFAAQMMFDLRIAYVTIAAAMLYLVFSIWHLVSKRKVQNILALFIYSLIIPLFITGLLHAFWIIPTLLFHVNTIEQLGNAFNSQDAVTFFSFAKFENTISLLHPNWPENIFGKTYFMKPEFLLLPILAFSSLLFIGKKSSKYILFFCLLGLVGAFLAKGANDPFGFIYLWMFDHVPGFVMFRDPTKWYVLIAISYSVLIPFSLWKISEQVLSKHKKVISYFVIILTILYFLFLIRPVFLGELGGTFKTTAMPGEYRQLKNFLSEENDVFRTLWIPRRQRFVFHSSAIPAVDSENLFRVSSASAVINVLKNSETERLVQEAGIRYVILPDDQQKELFLKNGKYDLKLYEQFVKELDKTSWLKKSQQFGKIIVYEVIFPKDRFWLEQGKLTYQTISLTDYIVSIENGKKGEKLVFADTYDSHWVAQSIGNGEKIENVAFDKRYNSFVLPKDGTYQVEVFFAPQKWVSIGGWISLVTLVVISVLIVKKR